MTHKNTKLNRLGMAFVGAALSGVAVGTGVNLAPGGLQDTQQAYEDVMAENQRLRALAADDQGLPQLALNTDSLVSRLMDACTPTEGRYAYNPAELYRSFTEWALQGLSDLRKLEDVPLTDVIEMTNQMLAREDFVLISTLIMGRNNIDAVYIVDAEKGRVLLTDNIDGSDFFEYFNTIAANDFAVPGGQNPGDAFVLYEDGRTETTSFGFLPLDRNDADNMRLCNPVNAGQPAP